MSHLQDPRIIGLNLGLEDENQYVEQEIQIEEYPEYEDDEYDDEGIDNLNIDEVEEVEKVDNNLAVDEDFQNSLNERIHELSMKDNTNSILFISRPKVKYNYTDKFSFKEELDEWFTSEESEKLHELRLVFINESNLLFKSQSIEEGRVMELFRDALLTPSLEIKTNSLKSILYIALGAFKGQFLDDDDISKIRKNVQLIIDSSLILPLITLMTDSFNSIKTRNEQIVFHSTIIYLTSSIIYIVLLIKLDIEEEDTAFKSLLDRAQLLHILTKFIDSWRWDARASLRIRNIITLFTKAFQYMIGDLSHKTATKNYLNSKFDIKKIQDENKLTNSPIEYHVFRQEILARYPSYVPPPSKLPSDFESSTSLLQFISIPKSLSSSLHKHHIPPAPPLAIHIATPAPSPPLSPQNPVNRTFKTKRSFQTNPHFPLIFPVQSNNAYEAPVSIKEATELFQSRVVEKLSLKQLWNERDLFVKQEKGFYDSIEYEDDIFQYFQEVDEENQTFINSLNRIEEYYNDSLPHFSSVIHVFLQILINSKDDFIHIQNLQDEPNSRHLEILIAKQVLVKNVSYSLRSLLEWLKVSHVLKFEYLSFLIYDSNYIELVLQQFKDTSACDRINLVSVIKSKKSIWLPCQSSIPSRPPSSAQSKPKTPPPTSSSTKVVDRTFMFTYINLLTVLKHITLKKSQRLLTITEKDPSKIFHNMISAYNKDVWTPVLKILKDLVPLAGKKWKSNNMDLVSLVYLHLKLDLSDNWLTTRDLEREANDAYGQEIAIRALVQFYNMRNYKESMAQLGYETRDGDFYVKEVDLGFMR